jgi:hypothetical protein
MDAVEIWEPYIVQYELYRKYRKIFNQDIRNFEYTDHYNVIIFGDILEHMTVDEARSVLEYAETHCDEVIVAVPYNAPNNNDDHENPFQNHVQGDLTPENMLERYPQLKLFKRYFEYYGYYTKASRQIDLDKLLSWSSEKLKSEDPRDILQGVNSHMLYLELSGGQLKDSFGLLIEPLNKVRTKVSTLEFRPSIRMWWDLALLYESVGDSYDALYCRARTYAFDGWPGDENLDILVEGADTRLYCPSPEELTNTALNCYYVLNDGALSLALYTKALCHGEITDSNKDLVMYNLPWIIQLATNDYKKGLK